jgi:hypothetical protein
MAARESQGLQITLGVFVVLTLLLCVASYFLFDGYRTQMARADAAVADAATEESNARKVITENTELKRTLGAQPDASREDIQLEFQRQIAVNDHPEEYQNYHAAMTAMNNLVHEKTRQDVANKANMAALLARLEDAEKAKKAQNDVFAKMAKDAEDDRDDQTTQFAADRSQLEQDRGELNNQLASMRTTVATATEEATTAIKDAGEQVTEIDNLNKNLIGELEDLKSETFEVAAGEVYRINQLHGVVWINLGSADSLYRQITFSVYSSDPNDVARRTAKAKIEVTKILGPHLAEARILEDTYADPITPGDLINTPAWSPGEMRRFALAGFMDIDGDSSDDRQLVRDIIAINGGVIDYELTEEGKVEGEVSIDTSYIIVGDAKEGALVGISQVQSRARELGVKVITVDKFLDLAGWKDRTRVLRFGRGESAGFSGKDGEGGEFEFRSPPKRGLPAAKDAKPESR